MNVYLYTAHITSCLMAVYNRPRSIYQYSSMAPRLSGQYCKFFKLLLSLNSQKRLGYKENNTKYRILTRKPRSHVRILIYRTWPILLSEIERQLVKAPLAAAISPFFDLTHPPNPCMKREIDHHTGNLIPYSFRQVRGFFNVPC